MCGSTPFFTVHTVISPIGFVASAKKITWGGVKIVTKQPPVPPLVPISSSTSGIYQNPW